MPAPYSDNLYSGGDDDNDNDNGNGIGNDWADEQDDALSPADGYFHASSSGLDESTTSSSARPVQHHHHYHHHHHQQQRQLSSVPFVPNVMVEDPTLREDQAAAKAREAEEERLINSAAAGRSSPLDDSQPHHRTTPFAHGQTGLYHSSHSQVTTYPQAQALAHSHSASASASASASSSAPPSSNHHHRRSIDDEISFFQPASAAGQAASRYTVHRQADAPPAYSPSASSPPPLSSSYQTFTPPQTATQSEAMGLPDENHSLLPRQPESMGGAPVGSREPLWRRIQTSTGSSTTRRKVRTVLGVLVILSIIMALFGGSLGVHNRKKPGIIDKSPVKAPPHDSPPGMSWPPNNGCLGEPRKSSKINEAISFGNGKRLSIVQTIERDGGNRRGRTPHVYGEVVLQPVDASSAGNIVLEVIANDQDLHVASEFDKVGQRFQVVIPRLVDWSEPRWQPCIQVRITVLIPREAQLESLYVEAVHLHVAIKDGLVLSSATDAQIKTVSGDVTTGRTSGGVAPYTLASRSIVIDTVSGDVAGWFPLYDLLKIHTVSGQIKVDIAPKPSSDKRPEQAVLNIESVSGGIKALEPVSNDYGNSRDDMLPPRDYVVGLSSGSGHITADLAFTSKAKIETVSGNQNLKLLPVFGSGSLEPALSTSAKSGQTTLTVFEPLWKSAVASIGHYDPVAPWPDHDGRDGDAEPKPGDDEPWIIIHPDEQPSRLASPANMEIKPSMAAGGGDEGEKHGLVDLKSHHASISGNFRINYPASWQGKFVMTTLSGSQDIRGKDLNYKRTGGIAKRIEGTKGNGKSDVTVDSMSGREELAFADA
ncbi:hypothetical protein Trco_006728 [Trichoderma cornu-damae]|uniref:Adhesin domain-containing protein n=1 Tax=Trichoderma cornu-damae TaxID=654480 RepID=A0A9P8QFK7_9HYPO|nr:hypothetical protein Trco_006728 [Trichoderma cornu-damae]